MTARVGVCVAVVLVLSCVVPILGDVDEHPYLFEFFGR